MTINQENSKPAKRTEERCQFLRWNGMYNEAEWDPTVQHGDGRAYWCNKSQICLGPDGNPVDNYECNETRQCYLRL
jgi:hypothetical protein